MIEEELKKLVYLKLLLNVEGIGPQKIFALLAKFYSLENIIEASHSGFADVEGIGTILASRIRTAKNHLSDTQEVVIQSLHEISKLGGKVITYWDNEYPALLKKIYYPPLVLYTLGEFTEADKNSIAIVGTRQPSSYGKLNAERFGVQLASKKLTIVSGLARGIDSIAHESCLKTGGRTIAVIGSGLDVIYPPENRRLFEKIKENGVIVSEFELGTKPDAQNFPRRNRIISGLSIGTLIIETKLTGGAMQTAAYALDQNREVFAIPGNINTKQSEGPNALIQKGEAKLVSCIDDILFELELQLKPQLGINIPKPTIELNLFEEKVLSVLDNTAKHIDEIASVSEISTADCLVNLLTLEFKGLVKQQPGKMFVRC